MSVIFPICTWSRACDDAGHENQRRAYKIVAPLIAVIWNGEEDEWIGTRSGHCISNKITTEFRRPNHDSQIDE